MRKDPGDNQADVTETGTDMEERTVKTEAAQEQIAAMLGAMKIMVQGLKATALANVTQMIRERPRETLIFTANANKTVDVALTMVRNMDTMVDDMSDVVRKAMKPIKDKLDRRLEEVTKEANE